MDRIDTKQAAVYLGVSVRRVISLIKSGHIPAEQFGGSWAIDKQDLAGVRRMLRSKQGKPSHPLKPLKVFGPYAIAEYREGTFLSGPDSVEWYAGLSAAEAISRLYKRKHPEGDAARQAVRRDLRTSIRRGDAADWAALLKYAGVGE